MDNLPKRVVEPPNLQRDLSPSETQMLAVLTAQIRDHLRDKSPEMTRKRGATIAVLRRLHHESAVPPLLAVARDETVTIRNRERATMAIAFTGGQAAVTALIELINSDALSVRSLSIQGLRSVTRHRVLPDIASVETLNVDELAALQKQWQQWWGGKPSRVCALSVPWDRESVLTTSLLHITFEHV